MGTEWVVTISWKRHLFLHPFESLGQFLLEGLMQAVFDLIY